MTFEEEIKNWSVIDTKINEINTHVKQLRNKRNDLEKSILNQVEKRELNSATIKLGDSRLKFVNHKINSPLTYKFLKESLSEIIEDENEVNEIINHIRNKREPKTALVIKRFFDN